MAVRSVGRRSASPAQVYIDVPARRYGRRFAVHVMVGFVDPRCLQWEHPAPLWGWVRLSLYVPVRHVRVGWFSWFLFSITPRAGIWDWHARWIVLYFLVENTIGAMVAQMMAGLGLSAVSLPVPPGWNGGRFPVLRDRKERRDNVQMPMRRRFVLMRGISIYCRCMSWRRSCSIPQKTCVW